MTYISRSNDNPLIADLPLPVPFERLPALLEGTSLVDTLTQSATVRDREWLLSRIENHFVPTPIAVEIADALLTAIHSGYLDRNPNLLEVKRQRYIAVGGDAPSSTTKPGFAPRSARCMTISGVTGLGKSTIVDRTLTLLPQTIEHGPNEAAGWNSQKQLVWIKVAMTSDGSRLGFIMQIYQQVDAALGTDYFAQYSSKKLTIEHHLVAVSKILFNCFLGALIVEEIQPRNFGEAASRDVMLLFFLRLANLGIPIVLIGNPMGFKGFENFTQDVRRLTSGGQFELWPAVSGQDRDWVEFLVPGMLEFNVMPKPPALNNAADLLFRHTGGVTDFLSKIVAQAQLHALRRGQDRITDADVLAAYQGPVIRANHPLIRTLVAQDGVALGEILDVPHQAFLARWGGSNVASEEQKPKPNEANSSSPQTARNPRFKNVEVTYKRKTTTAARRAEQYGEATDKLPPDDLRRDGLKKVLLENFETTMLRRRKHNR